MLVLNILEGYENKGHVVFTDNFCSSQNLLREHGRLNTGACGIVCHGCQSMSVDLHPSQLHLQRGDDPVFRRIHQLDACAWQGT